MILQANSVPPKVAADTAVHCGSLLTGSFKACIAALTAPEKVMSNAESVAKIVALILAGWWTYTLFIRHRDHLPRAQVDLTLTERLLPRGLWLVHAVVTIRNVGQTLMSVTEVSMELQDASPSAATEWDALLADYPSILPAGTEKRELTWRVVAARLMKREKGKFEIEPGESDTVHFDLPVEVGLTMVRAYAYVTNVQKRKPWWRGFRPRDIGWKAVAFHELKAPSASLTSVLE